MKKRIFFCASLIVFIISSSACAYYNVIDLGTLGGNASYAYSVNDNNQIVGKAYINSSEYRACFFDSTGHGNNINLKGSFMYPWGEARSINNSGNIVGTAGGAAYLFNNSGQGNNRWLGAGFALSINNSGQIVGGATSACLFDPTGGGNNINLGTLGGLGSLAYSINDNAQIVGRATDSSGSSHACLFDSTGGKNNTDLGTLGGSESYAYSINNSSQIVGFSTRGDSSIRACLFDPTGGGNNKNLGIISGHNYSTAFAINDNNQIVGVVYDDPAYYNCHACLFDPTGGRNNTDLNTLIDPSSGWTLAYAWDISNNGWIVGEGNHNGQDRAFLLVIPEPATIFLLTLGGLTLMKKH